MPTRRHRVYISCAMTKGDIKKNIDAAEAAFVALVAAGYSPFCPVWGYFAGASWCECGEGNDYVSVFARASLSALDLSHESWLAVDLSWVEVSDAVVRLPGESLGADMEVAYARSLNIPVYSSVSELLESPSPAQ